jgi:hypothetical protein
MSHNLAIMVDKLVTWLYNNNIHMKGIITNEHES